MIIATIKNRWFPSAEREEKNTNWLRLNLQFFSEEDDPEDELEDHDDDLEDDGPDLDELMKDPKFKKQYQAKLKEQLGKRMKKFKDVDPEEYRLLKQQADKKKQQKEDDDDLESFKSENKEKEQKLLRAERREKRAAVKEFAIDNGYNQKLLARLIDIDAVELDEDGEPENLEELFEEIQEEFPEYFKFQDDDEEEDDEKEDTRIKKKKASRYAPGSKQKGNKKREKDRRAAGAERARLRHKKEDDK